MEKIYESRLKEQEKLQDLKEKRQKLDEKIKATEAHIDKYTNMINQKKFSQVTDVLNSTGLSIDEVMAAIQKGDFLSLQEKIKKNEPGLGNTSSENADSSVSDVGISLDKTEAE